MTLTTIGLIGIGVLLILLLSKMPVGFVMGFVGLLGFGWIISWEASMTIASKDVITTFSSYNLSVMPLFIFLRTPAASIFEQYSAAGSSSADVSKICRTGHTCGIGISASSEETMLI